MNEKEQLMQNINGAMPIAQQMNPLEKSIDALEEKIAKNKVSIKLTVAAVIMIPVAFGIFPAIFKGGSDAVFGFFIVLIAVIIIGAFVKRILCRRNAKAKLDDYQKQFAALMNSASLSWLPEKYRTSSCIARVAEYVQNGRADTLKEALNLLENEMHQQRLEDSAFLGAYYANKSN